jgi:hypothetical protein
MSIIFRAHTDSRFFSFEAYASQEAAATVALIEALESHGRQYGLDEKWWEGHLEPEVHGFEVGRGYRDGSPLLDAPGIGPQAVQRAVVRAKVLTEHFSFDAYGRTRAMAKSALTDVLKAHGRQNGLKDGWWRSHYDLDTEEFKLGVGYRDHSPVPTFEHEDAPSGPSI